MQADGGLCAYFSPNVHPMAEGATQRRCRPVVAVCATVIALTAPTTLLAACAAGGSERVSAGGIGARTGAEAVAAAAMAAGRVADPGTVEREPGGPQGEPAAAATTTTTTTTSAPTAHLRVTQHITACCYPSGQVSWLVIRAEQGAEVRQRRFQPLTDVFPVVDTDLPAGRYRLTAAQQPCVDDSCGALEPPTDRCDAPVELAAGSATVLTVGVSPGAGCVIVVDTGQLVSRVADEIALPGDDLDCGFDPSLAVAAAADDAPPRAVARFLAAANRRAEPAWLMADESTVAPAGDEVVVYRSHTDRSVDVYRVVDPLAPTWAWTRTPCRTLTLDRVRTFLLQGCAAPVAVAWVATP